MGCDEGFPCVTIQENWERVWLVMSIRVKIVSVSWCKKETRELGSVASDLKLNESCS